MPDPENDELDKLIRTWTHLAGSDKLSRGMLEIIARTVLELGDLRRIRNEAEKVRREATVSTEPTSPNPEARKGVLPPPLPAPDDG